MGQPLASRDGARTAAIYAGRDPPSVLRRHAPLRNRTCEQRTACTLDGRLSWRADTCQLPVTQRQGTN